MLLRRVWYQRTTVLATPVSHLVGFVRYIKGARAAQDSGFDVNYIRGFLIFSIVLVLVFGRLSHDDVAGGSWTHFRGPRLYAIFSHIKFKFSKYLRSNPYLINLMGCVHILARVLITVF